MIDSIKITSLHGRGSVTMATRDYRGYWLEDVDWGQVEGSHNSYRYYNQIGESIVSTSVGSRSITISGWVIEDQATMRERCDFLNAFFSPVEDYELEYNGRKIQFRPDESVIYSRERKHNNKQIRQFMIQATAAFPLFTGAEATQAEFDESKKLFIFPNGFGMAEQVVFGHVSKTYETDINNVGGFETGINIKISFADVVKNPRVRNLTTGKFIGVNRTFSAGETLEISTVSGGKYMRLLSPTGQSENLIKYRDYQTSWIQLQPGGNTIAIDCEDLEQRGSMEVSIDFSPLYMEVE